MRCAVNDIVLDDQIHYHYDAVTRLTAIHFESSSGFHFAITRYGKGEQEIRSWELQISAYHAESMTSSKIQGLINRAVSAGRSFRYMKTSNVKPLPWGLLYNIGWENHGSRLEDAWRTEWDTVVLSIRTPNEELIEVELTGNHFREQTTSGIRRVLSENFRLITSKPSEDEDEHASAHPRIDPMDYCPPLPPRLALPSPRDATIRYYAEMAGSVRFTDRDEHYRSCTPEEQIVRTRMIKEGLAATAFKSSQPLPWHPYGDEGEG